MAKIAAKASTPTQNGARILYGESDSLILASQAAMFQRAGYQVQQAEGRKAIEQTLKSGHFDLVVLGHTLTRDDRHHLPYMAKKADPDLQVLVLHASGKHHAVDLAIDSRDGEEAVLQAILSLLERVAVTA
ncbi:MAG TPA: hypothetical protein VEG30_07990 [Terriglobales bacterium]|nr:hypothetical protein [Terriglobales bacterium]